MDSNSEDSEIYASRRCGVPDAQVSGDSALRRLHDGGKHMIIKSDITPAPSGDRPQRPRSEQLGITRVDCLEKCTSLTVDCIGGLVQLNFARTRSQLCFASQGTHGLSSVLKAINNLHYILSHSLIHVQQTCISCSSWGWGKLSSWI